VGIYFKRALHDDAFDATKPELDRVSQRAKLAQAKLRRNEDRAEALQDRENARIGVLAKTARLRAPRLAVEVASRKNHAPVTA
jgi:hypothetical protein